MSEQEKMSYSQFVDFCNELIDLVIINKNYHTTSKKKRHVHFSDLIQEFYSKIPKKGIKKPANLPIISSVRYCNKRVDAVTIDLSEVPQNVGRYSLIGKKVLFLESGEHYKEEQKKVLPFPDKVNILNAIHFHLLPHFQKYEGEFKGTINLALIIEKLQNDPYLWKEQPDELLEPLVSKQEIRDVFKRFATKADGWFMPAFEIGAYDHHGSETAKNLIEALYNLQMRKAISSQASGVPEEGSETTGDLTPEQNESPGIKFWNVVESNDLNDQPEEWRQNLLDLVFDMKSRIRGLEERTSTTASTERPAPSGYKLIPDGLYYFLTWLYVAICIPILILLIQMVLMGFGFNLGLDW